MINRRTRYRGCLLGLATGDAVGTTLEFRTPGSFEPISDMVGGGPFNLKAGQWTDDTSMALCLGHSLVDKAGFDANDQMQRYCDWRSKGYMSSNGRCFDIGATVSEALRLYMSTGDPYSGSTNPFSAGNGSLMRLAPVTMYFSPMLDKAIHFAGKSSRTTHAAKECIDACRYFSSLLHAAFDGMSKSDILQFDYYRADTKKVRQIMSCAYQIKEESDIKGSGYVIDALEAALWCFAGTDNFRDAILKAANLGDDADTTAAICGQIAGAYYGLDGIPPDWREKVTMQREIIALSDRLHDAV